MTAPPYQYLSNLLKELPLLVAMVKIRPYSVGQVVTALHVWYYEATGSGYSLPWWMIDPNYVRPDDIPF